MSEFIKEFLRKEEDGFVFNSYGLLHLFYFHLWYLLQF